MTEQEFYLQKQKVQQCEERFDKIAYLRGCIDALDNAAYWHFQFGDTDNISPTKCVFILNKRDHVIEDKISKNAIDAINSKLAEIALIVKGDMQSQIREIEKELKGI